MSDIFKLNGGATIESAEGDDLSADFGLSAVLVESLYLKNRWTGRATLSADPITTIPLPYGLAAAHVVILKVIGGSCLASLTSTAGADQAIPFDSLAIVISKTTGYTGLKLTRPAGVEVTVKILLGEKSS